MRWYRVVGMVSLVMVAFAANSVLARLALLDRAIGPFGFTAVRLCSGAVMLTALVAVRGGSWVPLRTSDLKMAFPLFVYALGFSLAYLDLETGMGALLLFTAVQISMVGINAAAGHRYSGLEWIGVLIALCGLGYMLSPAAIAPPLLGTLLMLAAGCGWGVYSYIGRGAKDPVQATTRNFQLAALMSLPVLGTAAFFSGLSITPRGAMLAMVSGAVTSGLGYVLWYAVLPALKTSVASSVQLTVPVLAAVGGIVWAGETLDLPFIVASAVILAGILLTIIGGGRVGVRTEDALSHPLSETP